MVEVAPTFLALYIWWKSPPLFWHYISGRGRPQIFEAAEAAEVKKWNFGNGPGWNVTLLYKKNFAKKQHSTCDFWEHSTTDVSRIPNQQAIPYITWLFTPPWTTKLGWQKPSPTFPVASCQNCALKIAKFYFAWLFLISDVKIMRSYKRKGVTYFRGRWSPYIL